MMKGWLGMTNSSTDIMKINIGPQHPSTHGVLRLIVELDGEYVKSVEPVVGYLHRGMEKMAENRSYLQYLPIVDRVDYLSGFFNSYAYCSAVEMLSEFVVPKRAEYIRVLLMELNRLASHLLWLGTFMNDLGATSPLFYCFREREIILSIFERLTGQRMMYNYFTFGGIKEDVKDSMLNEIMDFVDFMPKKIRDYENIITKNPIFLKRVEYKGVLSKNMALQYSITGPNLRACGVNIDFRKSNPYLVYSELDFEPPIFNEGDSYSRYKIRIEEMKLVLELVKQCVSWLKSNKGEVNLNINPVNLKIKEGEYTSIVEAPRGLTYCYLKSDGTSKPYRLKWRTGSFYAVQVLSDILIGCQYSDIMAIFGSLDVILPEVDR